MDLHVFRLEDFAVQLLGEVHSCLLCPVEGRPNTRVRTGRLSRSSSCVESRLAGIHSYTPHSARKNWKFCSACVLIVAGLLFPSGKVKCSLCDVRGFHVQWLSKLDSEGKNSRPLEPKAALETSPKLDRNPMEERHPESQTPTLEQASANTASANSICSVTNVADLHQCLTVGHYLR